MFHVHVIQVSVQSFCILSTLPYSTSVRKDDINFEELDRLKDLLNRIKEDLGDLAVVESFPNKVEGRQMTMMLAPKKK